MQQSHTNGSRLSRRSALRMLGWAAGAAVLAACGDRSARPTGGDLQTGVAPGPSPSADRLSEFAANIQAGGPPKDGIPPIDEPKFLAAAAAGFLTDEDVVFGVVHEGEAKAYPQLVLVWHEIVNDRIADGPLSVTYCPLTGSAVAFRGTAPGGEPYTFGTSGDLVNSNLLMYDRQTDSRWPQILATAIEGPARGARLSELPVAWTTWGRWRQRHPSTLVLSTDTGSLRDYGRDPYGSYTPIGGYYEPDSPLIFGVMHDDDRLPRKEVVIGVKHRGRQLAVQKATVRREAVVTAQVGGDPVVVLHDPALDQARAFLGRHSGKEITLRPTGDGDSYRDPATGLIFDASGATRDRPDVPPLERLVSYDVMWFAWVAFFPGSDVVL